MTGRLEAASQFLQLLLSYFSPIIHFLVFEFSSSHVGLNVGRGGGAESSPNEHLLGEWEKDHCAGPTETRLYFTGRVF